MPEPLTDGEIYALASFGGDKEAREKFIKEMKEALVEIEHAPFTVSPTSYLANLSKDDLEAETIAIHYQSPPKMGEHGWSYSFVWPVLIVSNYTIDASDQAHKVARILNKYWDEEEFNDGTD